MARPSGCQVKGVRMEPGDRQFKSSLPPNPIEAGSARLLRVIDENRAISWPMGSQ